jgi:hypothetical protein
MPELKVGWQDGPTERGTLTLVYSCLVTIFACTWTVLHLNVPALHEKQWRIALRKAKWMAITILIPEFIFSKAICDLRLALNDLRELDEELKSNDKVNLEWTTSSDTYFGKIEHTRSWQVDYGPRARFLYWILGLQPPLTRTRPVKKTVERVHDTPKAKSTSNMEDGRSSRYAAKENPEPDYRETRSVGGSQESTRYNDNAMDNSSVRSNNTMSIELDVLPSVSGPEAKPGEETTQVAQAGSTKDIPDRTQEFTRDPQLNQDRSDISSQELEEVRRYHTTQFWTPTHAYFANMGGLIYSNNFSYRGKLQFYVVPGTQLSYRYVWNGRNHPLHGLTLTKEDIEDKSKADWLLKGFTISQITWLVLTVLVRGTKDLPLTQLEIATLAFSIFAIVTYAANWWKPKDVGQPILLPNMNSGWTKSGVYNPTQEFTLRLRAPTQAREKATRFREEYRVRNDVVWMEEGVPLIFSIMAVSALVFGGLHCLAWNFQFPSRAERILWRVCSVTSMILPLDRLPAEFSERFTEPAFMSWSGIEKNILLSTPVGSRDFDKRPPKENRSQLEHDGTSEIYHRIVEDAEELHHHLCGLFRIWQGLKQGERNTGLPAELYSYLYSLESSYFEEAADFWDDYGNYLRRKLAALDSPPTPGYASHFLNVKGPVVKEIKRIDKQRDVYNQVSSLFIIGTGIVYIAARLIILVLLFTSLRSVPEGVYENTPWTRFLPNIS